MTVMNAKDLTREYPRSPYAKHAGTLGAYIPYPCGSDKRFLTYFGLDVAALEGHPIPPAV